MENQNAAMDLDSLLDGTLDDLADMPEFKPFPAGAHRVTIKWDLTKEINGQKCPELTLTAIETVELSNPEETPVATGDTTNMMFMFKKKDGSRNELSEGKFKGLLKGLQEHFKTGSNRETIESSQGAECLAVTKIRKDDKDKDNIKYYTDVMSLTVM
jgi:hypothetical protein